MTPQYIHLTVLSFLENSIGYQLGLHAWSVILTLLILVRYIIIIIIIIII